MIKELSNTEIIRMLGRRLKQYRLNLRVTQKQMAEETCISIATIQKLENGTVSNITLSSLLSLMRYLGIIEYANNFIPEEPESPFARKTRQRVRHGKEQQK